ncbi:hypothetical protein SLS59_006953 [Nothophoma quercina]|uniref:Uncharacterized protein n=1 Tax=Nothophoma quercina TaxID=749835 RepID=A0ABR3R1H0_9PLEO
MSRIDYISAFALETSSIGKGAYVANNRMRAEPSEYLQDDDDDSSTIVAVDEVIRDLHSSNYKAPYVEDCEDGDEARSVLLPEAEGAEALQGELRPACTGPREECDDGTVVEEQAEDEDDVAEDFQGKAFMRDHQELQEQHDDLLDRFQEQSEIVEGLQAEHRALLDQGAEQQALINRFMEDRRDLQQQLVVLQEEHVPVQYDAVNLRNQCLALQVWVQEVEAHYRDLSDEYVDVVETSEARQHNIEYLQDENYRLNNHLVQVDRYVDWLERMRRVLADERDEARRAAWRWYDRGRDMERRS